VAERVARPRSSGAEGELIGFSEAQALPILIVDDRPANLRALETALAPLEVSLEHARSGEEALRRLLEQDFALILLAVRMPGMDGLQTAELIKRRPHSAEIPIVLMTAADVNPGEIVRGYGIGAVDYVVRPFDPDLLRSKVSVFLELDRGRRALGRSEAFLRGAFEAAPIGKTVLDSERRILRANPAFARLLGRDTSALSGADVLALCHPHDRVRLGVELDRAIASAGNLAQACAETDVRLLTETEVEIWTGAVISRITVAKDAQSMLLIQWVDLTARRRAEQARADLLREHSARTEAEALAERLEKLQTLSAALESLQLEEILPELALRPAELFDVRATEVSALDDEQGVIVVRSQDGRTVPAPGSEELDARPPGPKAANQERWEELPVVIEHKPAGLLRLRLDGQRSLGAAERSLLHDAAGTNTVWHGVFEYGDAEKAFRQAAHVVNIDRLHCHRFSSTPLEGNAIIGQWEPKDGRIYFWCNNSFPTFGIQFLAPALGVHIDRIRVQTHDIGGSFGVTARVYMEGEQVEDKKGRTKKTRNDRLIAVAQMTRAFADIEKLDDLPEQFRKELEAFFVNYHGLEGKKYNLLGYKGSDIAMGLVKKAQKAAARAK